LNGIFRPPFDDVILSSTEEQVTCPLVMQEVRS
jgi:hypothetical protein